MIHYLRTLVARLRGLFGDRRADLEFDDEIEAHLRLLTERYVRQGMSEAEAIRAARRQFGNVTLLQEAHRDMRGFRVIDTFFQDARYGLWMMRRNPGFTFVAVITLALGIGANTAIFSVVNALVFNPLPYPEPQQLVWVTDVFRGDEMIGVSDYRTYQTQSKTFDGLAAFDVYTRILTVQDESAPVNIVQATASLFPTLGVAPRLGRAFTPEEARPGGPPVIILSYEFWHRRFGGDPSVVGRSVPFGGGSRLILGVMPPGFRFLPESRNGGNVDVWEQQELKREDNFILANVFGRLKPGVSIEQARAELDILNQPLIQAHPEVAGLKARVMPLAERLVGHLRRGLLTLFGTGGIVLLIACANVANLLLARASGRRQELAIRAALGAGRKRLIRQMLTESLLLAFIGGAAGLLLALLGVKALVAGAPDNLLQVKLSRIDASVLGFTFLSVLLTVIVAGLIPALQASRIDLSESLKDSGRGVALLTRKSARRISPALLVGELALTLVLLIGAGLLINSFLRLLAVDPGYDPKNLLTMVAGLRNSAQQKIFGRELLTRLNTLPGVQGAAYSRTLPLAEDGIIGKGRLTIVGRPPVPDGQKPLAESHYVSPDYFRVLGMRLRAGRGFTEQDNENTPPVVVINDTLARRYFVGEDPIGKQFRLEGSKTETELTIVGVVADVKRYGLEAETNAEIYHSSLQNVESQWNRWVIRTAGDPLKWVPAVRQQMRELAADVRIGQEMTMEQRLAESYAPRRFQAWLFGIFGALALVIATVGIYGVISYAVSQRTHEIGIRMALGAQASDVLRMVVWRGMSLTLVGVAIGLAVALALTRVIKSLLFNVSATDPATFSIIALMLVGVTFVAIYIPARRATKVDPLVALKYE